jgi:RHS repeat-associated protein
VAASPTATLQAASGWASVIGGWVGTAHAAAPLSAPIAAPVSVTYDTHGRLVREQRGGHDAFAVEYDSLGNRGGTAAARVDGIGNVLVSGKLGLAYNAAGELQRVTDERGVERAAYRYDAGGHRIAKQAGGETRYFMYDDGQLLAEADAAGRIVAEYVYLGRRPVARLRHDGGTRSWLPGMRPRPVIEYLHTDQRDAVDSVTDADGRLLWRGQLDAFGVLLAESGAAGSMPLRLAGQYADKETGLYYNVHRYYDPTQGRYLQADPLGLAAGLNMYAYTGNDPLNKTDPLGLKVEPDDGWGDIVRPWLFGTFVHSKFADQIRLRSRVFGSGWGANDGRDGTWKGLRPDAYFVKPGSDKDKYTGTLWELKPISWASDPKHKAGLGEVKLYKEEAKTGCWSAGSSSYLANMLIPDKVFMGNATYEVNYVADAKDASGLIFYTKKKLETKQAPESVPAPSLSKKDADELARQMQAVRVQGKKEGWSTVQEIGMVVLIGIAIALALAVAIFPATVAAIIASIGGAITAAASGEVGLMAALAAVFALGPSVAAAAETKGKEKEQGLLDGAIDWFKSWF